MPLKTVRRRSKTAPGAIAPDVGTLQPPEISHGLLSADSPAFGAIEFRSIASLIPYARNARLHDAQQLADLKRSMSEFGWTIPVLVDEQDGIVAGHARVIVGAELGVDRVPVIVARGWTDAKKRAYILADNKLTERGGWNWELVAAELEDLRTLGVDLELTGFEAHEIEPLLGADWRTQEDEPGESDNPHTATDSHQITVTAEQYEVIQAAIEREREAAASPRMSDGKALERIAERSMS
jgi:hypothetical protein